MFTQNIYPDRWLTWTITIILVLGLSIISYLRWVGIELETQSLLEIGSILSL